MVTSISSFSHNVVKTFIIVGRGKPADFSFSHNVFSQCFFFCLSCHHLISCLISPLKLLSRWTSLTFLLCHKRLKYQCMSKVNNEVLKCIRIGVSDVHQIFFFFSRNVLILICQTLSLGLYYTILAFNNRDREEFLKPEEKRKKNAGKQNFLLFSRRFYLTRTNSATFVTLNL